MGFEYQLKANIQTPLLFYPDKASLNTFKHLSRAKA